MPKASNDIDYVTPTQYKPSKNKHPDPFIEKNFKPMEFTQKNGVPRGLQDSDYKTPESLFRLFFDNPVIDLIVQRTNQHAEELRTQKDDYQQRPWKPVDRATILAYLGVLVHMGVHKEAETEMYWNLDPSKGPIHAPVIAAMSLVRWDQINRFFYVFAIENRSLTDSGSKIRPFEKLNELAALLKERFQRYYEPGTHVTIDECIQLFTGRASEIVNIPSKPVPIGYKIWTLAYQGYVLDFLWHARGSRPIDGPQGLDERWNEFSKTQQVVLQLLTQMESKGEGHVVWLDNLFSSARLFKTLRGLGIGAAGTVRTSKTRREEQEERRSENNRVDLLDCEESQRSITSTIQNTSVSN